MVLTTHPFHPVTGELLPAHRDAYLRGDLSRKSNELVDTYLKAHPEFGDAAFQRFYAMQQQGHEVRPVGWLQQQFELIRTEPARFRQRAATMAAVVTLLGGAVFAGTNLPTEDNLPTEAPVSVDSPVAAELAADLSATAVAAVKMTTISGRILNENGHPLAGATVIDKASHRGVSTNANGDYKLSIPAGRTSQVQFAYGGYSEDEMLLAGRAGKYDVTLVPQVKAKPTKRHWWSF